MQYIIKTKHAKTHKTTTKLGVIEITPKPLKPLYFRHSQKTVLSLSPRTAFPTKNCFISTTLRFAKRREQAPAYFEPKANVLI